MKYALNFKRVLVTLLLCTQITSAQKANANQSYIDKLWKAATIKKVRPNFLRYDYTFIGINRISLGPKIWQSWQKGFTYERKIYKNWYVGLSYAKWRTDDRATVMVCEVKAPFLPQNLGKMEWRLRYQFCDLTALYKLNILAQRHFLTAGIGVSYAEGVNNYMTSYIQFPPPGWDAEIGYTSHEKHYWGITPTISYDHIFFHDRLIAGFSFKARIYQGLNDKQYDVAAHFGINF